MEKGDGTVSNEDLRTQLVRIDERLQALQRKLDSVCQDITDLRNLQHRVNGKQRAAEVKVDEFTQFMEEMREFKEDLLEWKGAMTKQAGIVGIIAGTIPATGAILFIILEHLLK